MTEKAKKKNATLETLADQMQKGFASIETRMEKGFASVADDMADIRKEAATKEQIIALHTQVNSIETQLKGMHHTKLLDRVAGLEEEVFGESRA
jgi:hypothetical protein